MPSFEPFWEEYTGCCTVKGLERKAEKAAIKNPSILEGLHYHFENKKQIQGDFLTT